MNKQQYLELLKLGTRFTYEELLESFTNEIRNIRVSNISVEEKINYANELNQAINYLRQYTKKKIGDNDNIYSNKKCNMFGMTYEETLHMLNKKNTEGNIGEVLDNINDRFKDKFQNRKYIFPLTIQSEDLWSFPIDRLVSMFLLDSNNKGYFASYIITLSNMCNDCRRYDNNFSLENEYREFIFSEDESFLLYLSQKIEIKYICNVLNVEEYELRHKYDYANEKFDGSFNQYLVSLFEIKTMTTELSLSPEDLNKYYNEYKKAGYNDSIYLFLRDFYEVREYCGNKISIYLLLKSQYLSIPDNERLISFKNWIQLRAIQSKMNMTSDQIIESIYFNAKENGFEGNLSEYVQSLPLSKEKRLTLK